MLVAVIGALVPYSPVPATALAIPLVVVPAVALVLAWRRRLRGAAIAELAAGASFSLFFAAYLMAAVARPGSVTFDEREIAWIGEGALLSLTIGVAGGTLDVVLTDVARAIAFVQILLTGFGVAAAIWWAWLRLIDRLPAPGAPEEG